MLLATRNLGVGDTRLYKISYKEFLARGATLVTEAVTVPAGTKSTIGTITLDPDAKAFTFFVVTGSIVESFTASIAVKDSTGQIVNDTMDFQVLTP